MNIVFYILLAYILYRFVFHFLIPIIRTTRQVKRSFRDIHEKMNSHMNGHSEPKVEERYQKPAPGKKEDYIDFEEIKD
jgi:hypothetical protein